MTRRGLISGIAAAAVLLASAWGLTRGLEWIMNRPPADASPADTRQATPPSPAPVRHITATLFYATPDAQFLVPVQREVPFGDTTVEQGRQIVLAQLQLAPPRPLLSAIPSGTTLRAFYVSERGDAFVDLGPEIVSRHPGGSAAELLTVYAIVNAVTANLPAIMRVQILLDGREAETLAGHLDLRRPLQRNEALVRQP